MATDLTPITVIGNLTADPELRYTQNGLPVVNLTVAQTPRIFDKQSNEWKDGEASFFRGTAWRTHAEHIAASFKRGQRVIMTGGIRQRNYQDRDGNNRSNFEVEIEELGHSVKFGVSVFTRSDSGGNKSEGTAGDAWTPPQRQPQASGQPQQAQIQQQDAWAPQQGQQQLAMAGGGQPQQDAWTPAGAFGDDTPF